MTLLLLKIIACLSMLIDHIGIVFGIVFFRIAGRIAFPIFAFLISNGFLHTKNVKKYVLRLVLLALISEIPFDLFLYGKMFYWGKQNVIFTLLLGLLFIVTADYLKKHNLIWLSVFPLAFSCLMAVFIKCDYGYIGVAAVAVFYLFSNSRLLTAASFIWVYMWNVISYVLYSSFPVLRNIPVIIQTSLPTFSHNIRVFGILALIPILMYNGEYGIDKKYNNAVKYGFYLFYPVHLLILYVFVRIAS